MNRLILSVVFAGAVTLCAGSELVLAPGSEKDNAFCKHTNRMCRTSEEIGEPLKVKSAEKCLEKCMSTAGCTGVDYLEDKQIKKRCQLRKGQCGPGNGLEHFYGSTAYTRLENADGDSKCPQDDDEPYCPEGEQEVVSGTYKESGGGSDTRPTAQCPDNHVISRCECSTGFFGAECTEMKINGDMKSCSVAPKTKVTFQRARACCRPLKDDVVPYPFETKDGVDSYTCPENTEAICSQFAGTKAVIPSEGLQLTSATNKRKCEGTRHAKFGRLAVICLHTYEMNNVENRDCAADENRVDADSVAEGAGTVSEATCPEGAYASHCACEGDGQCGGTSLSDDARTCKAYGAEGVTVKAKVCCVTLAARQKAVVVSDPKEEDSTTVTPYADCPQGGTLVTCLIKSSASAVYVDGARCWSPHACQNCRVQAVCTRDIPEPVGEFECAEGEREVIAEKYSNFEMERYADRESIVACHDDEYVTRCECEEENGKYCLNVGVLPDWGGKGEPLCKAFTESTRFDQEYVIKTKAKACCAKKKKGEVITIVSSPEGLRERHGGYWWPYFELSEESRGIEGPSAECPENTEIVYCNLYKLPSNAFPDDAPIVEGNRCYASGFCRRCAIDLICKSV